MSADHHKECAHGVALSAVCDKCAESYGSARAMPANPNRVVQFSPTMQLRWNGGVLEQQWVGDGGVGPYEWRPVPVTESATQDETDKDIDPCPECGARPRAGGVKCSKCSVLVLLLRARQ